LATKHETIRQYLSTSDVARAGGVHPNTVLLYEAWGYLQGVTRTPTGYRQFTHEHVRQMQFVRLTLQVPYPGGKALIESCVRKAAMGDLDEALQMVFAYLSRVHAEQAYADQAVAALESWANARECGAHGAVLQIRDAARTVGLSVDVLRSWERSGLLDVPRNPTNGYRLYEAREIGRLQIIRLLRMAGYSPLAILRMLLYLDEGHHTHLREVLDTPRPQDEVYVAADRWLTSLAALEMRVRAAIANLEERIALQTSICTPGFYNEKR
jgi:DNA-binding transcriptional MerR regulator